MPVPPVETISEALRPLTERPEQAAILCDIDGTLAPIVDKGAIMAFHWRGARDEAAALTAVEAIAAEAESAGLLTHWGRKVLEIRPPVPIDKGQAVRELLRRTPVRTALFGGDDATDLDVFDVLSDL